MWIDEADRTLYHSALGARRQPPRHDRGAVDGPAPSGRRRRPGRRPASAARCRLVERPRLRRRRAHRSGRARRRHHHPGARRRFRRGGHPGCHPRRLQLLGPRHRRSCGSRRSPRTGRGPRHPPGAQRGRVGRHGRDGGWHHMHPKTARHVSRESVPMQGSLPGTPNERAHHRPDRRSDAARGELVALVPTMGALHDGHIQLLKHARPLGDTLVASIFVNPTQFAPGEDFEEYPRTFDADVERCAEAGVDVVFAPSVDTMYPTGLDSTVMVDPGPLGSILEGSCPTRVTSAACSPSWRSSSGWSGQTSPCSARRTISSSCSSGRWRRPCASASTCRAARRFARPTASP